MSASVLFLGIQKPVRTANPSRPARAASRSNLWKEGPVPIGYRTFFGGGADVLPNGNLEYDLCAGLPSGGAVVVELPQDPAVPLGS